MNSPEEESREALEKARQDRYDARSTLDEARRLAGVLMLRRHENHFGPLIKRAITGG